MKQFTKKTRRRDTRRMRRIAAKPLRAPKPVARDMIAYAAALEILG